VVYSLRECASLLLELTLVSVILYSRVSQRSQLGLWGELRPSSRYWDTVYTPRPVAGSIHLHCRVSYRVDVRSSKKTRPGSQAIWRPGWTVLLSCTILTRYVQIHKSRCSKCWECGYTI